MEKYMVNGVEIQYDAFDIDNIEKWDEEVRRVADEAKKPRGDDETAGSQLRRVCYSMLDLFDAMCGDGTAQEVFGEAVNVKAIYEGYASFVKQVSEKMMEFSKEAPAMFQREGAVTPVNRAQRRREQDSRR